MSTLHISTEVFHQSQSACYPIHEYYIMFIIYNSMSYHITIIFTLQQYMLPLLVKTLWLPYWISLHSSLHHEWKQPCPFGKNRGACGWYTTYHHETYCWWCCKKGPASFKPLFFHQPTNGNLDELRTSTGWWFQTLWKYQSIGMIIPNCMGK